ncbi:MAG: 30S ribosomal protein S1 [Flavobacteriales bacterium]|nr:30S ribosomal protein S1 [Flavobacteriales bacterium]
MVEENNGKLTDLAEGEVTQNDIVEKVVDTSENTNDSNLVDDFDWDNFENEKLYSDEEFEKLKDLYSETLESLNSNDIIEGIVLKKTDKDVIIDISGKSEGVISSNEFRYNPDLKEGDKVEVVIDKQEDKTGQLVLSHKKARYLKSWGKVNDAHDNGEIVDGYVICRTKGGMIVDVFGLEAFLPGSQIDVKPIRDYDLYVGKNMKFKVVKINPDFRNVVVSHKALIEADIEEQKKEIISKLEKGQVLEGIVKNITAYGVFIDLGGVDGLIHITDLSWSRINHPNEIVTLDEKIKVVILDFDDNKNRIQLGLKQLFSHPWESLSDDMKVGDRVKGKVVVLADYGAFVEIQDGVEALVHVSEMSWSANLRSAQDFLKIGDEVEAVIITLDREDRKMSLGIKQLTPNPWESIAEKYPVDTKLKGKITNYTNFGVFVELEEGVDGLVHISDLSWTKKIKHPADFVKLGEELEVIVLEIDVENRRLSLGHKQLKEDPWNVYETIFTLGSIHSGEVLDVFDKGANIIFKEQGLESFCPSRHSIKKDKNKIEVGENLDFEVIEFNRESNRILVSHSKTFMEDLKKEANEKRKEKSAVNKKVKKMRESVEKSTLGDIDALSDLKNKIDE